MNNAALSELHVLQQHIAGLLQRGANVEAQVAAAEAQTRFPTNAGLLHLHGIALLRLDRSSDALAILQHAESLAPDDIGIQCDLARIAIQSSDTGRARERLHAALRRPPQHLALLLELGHLLIVIADYAQARETFTLAARRAPKDPAAYLGLATIELELGNPAQAATHIDVALRLAPKLAAAHAMHGYMLQMQGRTKAAAEAYLQAEQAAPQETQHLFRVGQMLDQSGQLESAADAYARALQLDPSSGLALSQLLSARRRLCDWRELDELSEQVRRAVAEGRDGILPFSFLAEDSSAIEQHCCASIFARRIEQRMAPLRHQLNFKYAAAMPNAPMKVGFVSNGFGEHPLGLLTVALFEALKREAALDVHLFATTSDDGGSIRRRLASAATIHDLAGQHPTQMARHVHATGIEILFDLRGHGAGSNIELFELRPAPVQVNWLAYPATSGAPWMDYVLADAVVLPTTLREGFSEKVLRLPRCFQPNDPDRVVSAPPARSECGLPAQGIVFASFNPSYKINPGAFARFMQILREVPGSVLWLQSGPEGADQRLRSAAAAALIAPERLVFMPRLQHSEYLARYRHVDLFLDTLPYNAHATASDALWAGCPLLTCAGQTFAGRISASLLHHVGLPEMITENEEAYVAMAVQLGNDPSALSALRGYLVLAHEHSPLFDMSGFALDFRRVVQAIGTRNRIGRPPIDLAF